MHVYEFSNIWLFLRCFIFSLLLHDEHSKNELKMNDWDGVQVIHSVLK